MCKLMTITSTKKIENLGKVVNSILPLITATDRDGFGWASINEHGLFGERMTNLRHGYRMNINKFAVNLPIVEKTYNSFGQPGKPTGSLILHGRTSTNKKTLNNTHPINLRDWSLVHNGVVTNRGPDYTMTTDNDTEHLVHYMSSELGITGIEQNLTGYYAFAALAPDGKLHVCRDNRATLHMAWVRSIEAYMIATTRDLIESACKKLKWKHGPIEALLDNTYCIFDGNDPVEVRSITPRGSDYYADQKARTSLHYLSDGNGSGYGGGYSGNGRWNNFDADYVTESYGAGTIYRPKTAAEKSEDSAQNLPAGLLTGVDSEQVSLPQFMGEALAEVDPREAAEAINEFGVSAEALDEFLEETALMDASYRIYDANEAQIEVWEFLSLNLTEKLMCLIYRHDGTILSADSIERDLALGEVSHG